MIKILIKQSIKLIKKFRKSKKTTIALRAMIDIKFTSHPYRHIVRQIKSTRFTGFRADFAIFWRTEARTNVKRVHHSKLEAAAGLSLTSCRFVRTGGGGGGGGGWIETRYAADQIIRSNLLFQAGINSGRARSGQWTLYRERSAASAISLGTFTTYTAGNKIHKSLTGTVTSRDRTAASSRFRISSVVVASPLEAPNNSCVNKPVSPLKCQEAGKKHGPC